MKRWQHYSQDPNNAEVLALRQQAVGRARSGTQIPDRIAYLCELAAGKSVLDIGVVEHTADSTQSPLWLHGHLKRCAARCVGVDVLEPETAKLREQGFDVLCADVTSEPLPQKFEVIIGGEVLEHLDAPGRFMHNCAAMLSEGGRLAITVPNPWYVNVMIKNLWCWDSFVDSADHVAWYEASVLYELGQRHGLELQKFTGIGGTWARSWRARLFFGLRPLLIKLGVRAELFCKSIIYEFVRV